MGITNLTSMDITNLTSMDIADNNNNVPSVLGRQTKWEDLFFYQKADVIYQLSFVFCDRFIHLYKDRTRDQVIQAARSCKQNIVEGLADGVTSSEMQLKLLNVARASLKELREDFEDYLKSRHREFYVAGEERYDVMLDYCSRHNKLKDYEPFFQTWSDEQMCNSSPSSFSSSSRSYRTSSLYRTSEEPDRPEPKEKPPKTACQCPLSAPLAAWCRPLADSSDSSVLGGSSGGCRELWSALWLCRCAARATASRWCKQDT